MTRFTKYQAEVVTGFTGILCMPFSDWHEAVEAKLGRPVHTMEMASKSYVAEVKEAYRAEFLELCAE